MNKYGKLHPEIPSTVGEVVIVKAAVKEEI